MDGLVAHDQCDPRLKLKSDRYADGDDIGDAPTPSLKCSLDALSLYVTVRAKSPVPAFWRVL